MILLMMLVNLVGKLKKKIIIKLKKSHHLFKVNKIKTFKIIFNTNLMKGIRFKKIK